MIRNMKYLLVGAPIDHALEYIQAASGTCAPQFGQTDAPAYECDIVVEFYDIAPKANGCDVPILEIRSGAFKSTVTVAFSVLQADNEVSDILLEDIYTNLEELSADEFNRLSRQYVEMWDRVVPNLQQISRRMRD